MHKKETIFDNYVWWDSEKQNLTLNLTSNSYANLTLSITPTEVPVEGVSSFDLRAISRTEQVYTRTFDLVVEEKT